MDGKYEALVAIDYEPAGQEMHHKHLLPGDTFVYPEDVSTPDGSMMDIEWLLANGKIRKVRTRK